MAHLRFFSPAENSHSQWKTAAVEKALSSKLGISVKLKTEHCFHVVLEPDISAKVFEKEHLTKLSWLLAPTPFSSDLSNTSFLHGKIKEIGPRLTFKTAYCTNAMSAMRSAGIEGIARVEKTTRYQLDVEVDDNIFLELAGDRMTEFVYPENVDFALCTGKADFFEIDILGNPENLDKANTELGLAFDSSDLEYYKDLFVNKLKRNPTDVELFDLAQSDSEHSRHWFFRGKLIIDGKPREATLMNSVRDTQKHSNPNNLIAFSDNSSAIEGFSKVRQLLPIDPTRASPLTVSERPKHIIYSAETHNFPTAVCPFQGATTGTGGRIRDIHATGRGAHEIAGVAGYSFGNLHLDNYRMPWEDEETYPSGFSHPSQIAVEASNGASDYGNKFGEPVLCGFARSFGQRLPNGERCEYVKPIMFSGGLGAIDEGQTKKESCNEGMLLAKIGGPVYRIGVGGGAASSLSVQGSRESHLDFGAVQRGDAEMEQKLHRIIRACVEMGDENPILSIHDQGAGGNGNVLKELVEGGGAVIDANTFELGDETISCRELWTAEYQENDACLVDPNLVDKMMAVAKREKCRVSVVGTVTSEQRVILKDYGNKESGRHPVDFDTKILGEREKKTFHLTTQPSILKPLTLPTNLPVRIALEMVLRLPSVASKRWLTCKVDRSVTGLVAQQQCVGPLQTPLADVAVVALSHFDKVILDGLNLPQLPHILFHSNLRSLRVSHCGLRALSGTSFLSIPHVEHIDLSDNHLETLPPTLFRGLKNLKVINLARNRITDLSLLTWILAENVFLERLDLSGNPLSIATKATFLPPSRQLLLSDCQLEKFNSTAIVFLPSTACPLKEDCRTLFIDAQEMSQLETLVLSGNKHLEVEMSALDLIENVTYLDLSEAQLPSSFGTWLEERSRVRFLNISHTDIVLEDFLWNFCGEYLETLDISGIKAHRVNLGRDCPVKVLHAQKNLIETTRIEALGLETLNLRDNMLVDWPELPPGTSLDRLKSFSLSKNLLTSLPPDALSRFPSLQHLDLSHNQLAEVDRLAFPSVGLQLVSLDLSSNQLSLLPHPVLPSLLYLDASSNALVTVDPVLFTGLPLLQHLKLANNPLLFSRCQESCWSEHLEELTELLDLDLSNCGLERNLPLRRIRSLKSLLLRGNSLVDVDGRQLPEHLSILDLGENRIHFTSNFSHLESLRDLRVDSNPLRCHCSVHDMVPHLLNQSQIADTSLYYCYSGSWQYPLLPYLQSVRPCSYDTRSFLPVLVSTVLFSFLVVSSFALAFLLYRRLSFCKSAYSRLSTELPVGAAVAVGEQPIKGLVSPSAGARMTVAETLTNLVFAPITDLKDVKMSGNWMWAAKCEGEGARLVEACDALCRALKETGTAIDGGKDSLSMAAKAGGELVKAPGTLVLSAYAPCTDVTKVVTPNLKGPQDGANHTAIVYVRMGNQKMNHRLGGGSLAQVLKQIGDDSPDVEDFSLFVRGFETIQRLIKEDKILAGHDVSDGGWITALLEMAFTGNMQIEIQVNTDGDVIPYLFAEEAGVFLEIEEKYEKTIENILKEQGIESKMVGKTTPIYGPDAMITLEVNGEELIKEKLTILREVWEETGDILGAQQTSSEALSDAKKMRMTTRQVAYRATFDWGINQKVEHISPNAPRIAIIREEGSNGDREMAAAFTLAGFQTVDVTMSDMLDGHKLDSYSGIAFVGGFSYADVLGSAKGWAAAITFNKEIAEEFEIFRRCSDTFSFGVCNGCQLMALLGWVGEYENAPGVFLAENKCGRFESSFGPVRIESSNSIMLKGMDGSVLGLWSSHGEGRFTYRSQEVKKRLDSSGCVAVRYVDGEGQPTLQYPWNPNGSEDAVAALCSEDGRHLAIMPHTDRSFLEWQWADYPREWRRSETPVSPWIKMFRNAYDWVVSQ